MEVRVDKWLWAVRIFKTRSKATDACKSGRVTMDGKLVKASRMVSAGDIIDVRKENYNLKFEVKEVLEKRVGAKLVENYMIDLTPEEEYHKFDAIKGGHFEYRDRGVGRPTKRERREIDRFKDLD